MTDEKKREIWRRATRKYRTRPEVRASLKEYSRIHEALYKERRHELNVRYNVLNKKKKRALEAAWGTKNPEKIKSYRANRYAHRRGAEGSHTDVEWVALCLLSKGICIYCQKPAKLTRDHFIPLSNGGSNYIANIVPACSNCNSSKKNKPPEETAQWMADRTIARLREFL